MTNTIKKICCNCGHWNLRDGDELDIPIRCNHKDNPDTSSYAGAYCEHFTWADEPYPSQDSRGHGLMITGRVKCQDTGHKEEYINKSKGDGMMEHRINGNEERVSTEAYRSLNDAWVCSQKQITALEKRLSHYEKSCPYCRNAPHLVSECKNCNGSGKKPRLDIQKLKDLFRQHYWDSVSQHKDIIIQHSEIIIDMWHDIEQCCKASGSQGNTLKRVKGQ